MLAYTITPYGESAGQECATIKANIRCKYDCQKSFKINDMQSAVNSGVIYKATLVASVGGLLFGYDTAVISGAIGFMRSFIQLSDIMTGWVASCALLGCIAGAMYSVQNFSDRAGRKKFY